MAAKKKTSTPRRDGRTPAPRGAARAAPARVHTPGDPPPSPVHTPGAPPPGSGRPRTNGKAARLAESLDEAPVSAETARIGDEAYQAVLPRAQALAEREVEVVEMSPTLALHNVRVGVESVLDRREELSSELRRFDENEVKDVETLALAYGAASRHIKTAAQAGRIEPLYRKLAPLRQTVLSSAISLANAGVVPRVEVEQIQRGRGKVDAVQDGLDLAVLFRRYAQQIAGKTPITAQMLEELEQVAMELQPLLKPTRAKKSKSRSERDAIDLKNRIGTLLVRGWKRLWKLGALAYGEEVDRQIPALQSARRGKIRPKTEEDPTRLEER